MLNRIDRYITGLFWGYFLGGLAVFITLFLSVDAMSTMVSYGSVPFVHIASYYGFYLPEVLYRLLPVACLVGAVFTLNTLNRSHELVALFSCGMSLTRVIVPILVSVVLVCGIGLFLSDQVVPNFIKQKNFVFYHYIRKNPSMFSIVRNERIWYRTKDKIFNIKTLNQQENRAQGLSLYYFNDNWDLLQMITADEVILGPQKWRLLNGSVTFFTQDSSFPHTSDFKEKTIPMDRDTEDLSSTGNTSDMLSIKELGSFIKRNKEAGLDTIRYEVDYHSKFGYAVAGLVMTLLGIPFCVQRGRSSSLFLSMGVVLGLIFFYWVFYSSSITLGNYGQIPPLLAAWTPNFLTALLALYFIKRRRV